MYTLAFTFDWYHTVNAVAPRNTLMAAATTSTPRRSVQCDQTRTRVRKKKPAEAAEKVALMALIRTATGSPVHERRMSDTRPTITKNGFPGGCGMPRMCAVAMYSDVSQNAVLGARVMR